MPAWRRPVMRRRSLRDGRLSMPGDDRYAAAIAIWAKPVTRPTVFAIRQCAKARRREDQRLGSTFWLRLKKFVGSYLVLSSTSRA
jgi:hypothetical protein